MPFGVKLMRSQVLHQAAQLQPQTECLQAFDTAEQQESQVTEGQQSSGLSTRCTMQPQTEYMQGFDTAMQEESGLTGGKQYSGV